MATLKDPLIKVDVVGRQNSGGSVFTTWPLGEYGDALNSQGGTVNAVRYAHRDGGGDVDLELKAMTMLRDVENGDFKEAGTPVPNGAVGFEACDIDGVSFVGEGYFMLLENGKMRIEMCYDKGSMSLWNSTSACCCCTTPFSMAFSHSHEKAVWLLDLSSARSTMTTTNDTTYRYDGADIAEEGDGCCKNCCIGLLTCGPCKCCCKAVGCAAKAPEHLSLTWKQAPSGGKEPVRVKGIAGWYTADKQTIIDVNLSWSATSWDNKVGASPVRKFMFYSAQPDEKALDEAMEKMNTTVPATWNGGKSTSLDLGKLSWWKR